MKQTRRRFLATTTAVSAASALRLEGAGPRETPPPFRIDCQSHLFCADLITLMEKRKTDPRVYTKDGARFVQMGDGLRKIPPRYLDVDAKLATMDAAGIALTALSINDPGPEWFGSDGPAVAPLLNDFIGPDRLLFFQRPSLG